MLLVDELGVAIKACEGLGTIPYKVSLSKVLAESVNGKRPERVREGLTTQNRLRMQLQVLRSLRTYILKLVDLFSPKKVGDATEPSEVNHELLIELLGTMGLKKVEIVVVCFSTLLYLLHWLMFFHLLNMGVNVGRSLEYLDKDETVVAHVVGGVDAFIKVPQDIHVLNTWINGTGQTTKHNSISDEKHCVHLLQICPANNVFGDVNSPQLLSFLPTQQHKHLFEQHPRSSYHWI
ncbi:hypothetical protein ACE6H2_001605 [Prunus campanulata]